MADVCCDDVSTDRVHVEDVTAATTDAVPDVTVREVSIGVCCIDGDILEDNGLVQYGILQVSSIIWAHP